MSKIYEALEKLHDDPFSSEDVAFPDSGMDRAVPKFHQRGIDLALGDSRTVRRDTPQAAEQSEVVSINLNSGDEALLTTQAKAEEQSSHTYRYTIGLDDIRGVSAAIRSSVSTQRARCIGFIGLGAGETGAALVRDVAAYEARLDVDGVLLVDADRIRISQSKYFEIDRGSTTFDLARNSKDWATAALYNVADGVNLVCFSEDSDNLRQPTDKATYKSFVTYCRTAYELSLFDLPADGPGSEAHHVGALLDAVVIVYPKQIDIAVVNRYIDNLVTSGVNVLGAINIA